MEALFQHVNHWSWWVFAVGLMVLEAIVPGSIFMWLGIAAVVVGFMVWLLPGIGWEYQIIAFVVISLGSILTQRRSSSKNQVVTDRPALNSRGEQYIGRTFTLSEPIVNGQGNIRVDDTTWKVVGEDCDAGSLVKVAGVEGTQLKVERIDSPAR